MAEITAAAVKDLREKSGAGMMDCKKALTETNGDMEAAVDWLRAKGLATASKKSSRTAAEGLVGVAVSGTSGAAVEVNSETDFVAKNEQFQSFVREVTAIALSQGDDVEALKNAAHPAGGSVSEVLTNNIATIGENQSLRRAKKLTVSEGVVVPYVHNAAAPGLGKIGVLIALESAAPAETLEALGKQLTLLTVNAQLRPKKRPKAESQPMLFRRWSTVLSPSSLRKTRFSTSCSLWTTRPRLLMLSPTLARQRAQASS
jgi:elongation factor Ts